MRAIPRLGYFVSSWGTYYKEGSSVSTEFPPQQPAENHGLYLSVVPNGQFLCAGGVLDIHTEHSKRTARDMTEYFTIFLSKVRLREFYRI